MEAGNVANLFTTHARVHVDRAVDDCLVTIDHVKSLQNSDIMLKMAQKQQNKPTVFMLRPQTTPVPPDLDYSSEPDAVPKSTGYIYQMHQTEALTLSLTSLCKESAANEVEMSCFGVVSKAAGIHVILLLITLFVNRPVQARRHRTTTHARRTQAS